MSVTKSETTDTMIITELKKITSHRNATVAKLFVGS